jgi:hypothetical protein
MSIDMSYFEGVYKPNTSNRSFYMSVRLNLSPSNITGEKLGKYL